MTAKTNRPNLLVFEDGAVENLRPMSTSRPSFALSVGTYRLYDLLTRLECDLCAVVRPHLREIVRLDYPEVAAVPGPAKRTLLINARLVPVLSNFAKVISLIESSTDRIIRDEHGRLIAAIIDTSMLGHIDWDASNSAFVKQLDSLIPNALASNPGIHLLDYPHDLISEHLQGFGENLNDRIERGKYREISDGVFVAESTKISDFVVTNTRTGPIVIEADTVIGPFCYLRGPVFIGPNSRINEHASIKDCVSVGHTVKIGGEVEGSIIDSYTNKQHHGFLGHSYLGQWINLGAGTCNSDLKNTYGEVKMDYLGEKISTGMQFVGCFIGDYSKTAINTSIFTGKVIGVCSMLYGFVTTNVPSFVNYARSFGQVTESPVSVMIATQKRMFSRRNVAQRPVDIQLLADMFEMTRGERQLSEEPLSL